MAKNKIIFGNEVLIDLTGDTVRPETMLSGTTAHDKSGEVISGTCTYDSDTTDATISVAEMLDGKTAYARGAKVVGTMPNKGSENITISDKNDTPAITMGFHDGGGAASISDIEKDKIIASNIKAGITILGVTGEYTGAAIKAQSKSVTPSKTATTVQPDSGYDYLSSVEVNAIPYAESPNSAGGTTVTIG